MFPTARAIPLLLLTASLATPCLGEAVPRVEFTRELAVTGKYLILPIANHRQNRFRITVTADGRLVHRLECDFPPDRGSIDWWTYLEMGDYRGKTATITGNAPAGIPGLFEARDELRNLAPFYDEALRPQLRFS